MKKFSEMLVDALKIITLCTLVAVLSSCGPRYIPPNTQKECVGAIYQKRTSGGAPIFESFNVTLHSPTDGTPGITYITHNTMRAAADGWVSNIETLRTGRAGGEMVTISHGRFIYTMYAHLYRLYVKLGDNINRGDPVGNPDEVGYPKLLLKMYGNWESPDNWGPNHDLMVSRKKMSQYPKNNPELSGPNYMGPFLKQFEIVENLYNQIGIPKIEWFTRKHNPSRRWDAVAQWSLVEHMRYLQCLHETEPEKFKDLSSENFYLKRDQFYKNQPLGSTQ